jgi:hypothetical protein
MAPGHGVDLGAGGGRCVSERTLAQRSEFAAVATALDPITSAIVLDARLVRPPSGVPVRLLAERSARLVGVGIDDLGQRDRTLKIALVYDDEADARADAPLIEQALPTTPCRAARASASRILPPSAGRGPRPRGR